MPLMTLKDYAEYRGCSPAMITKAVKLGVCPISMNEIGQKMIDSEKADEAWPHGKRLKTKDYDGKIKIDHEVKSVNSNVPPIIQSRGIKEAYQSRMAKLDYEERIGKTIEAETVKEDAFRLARIVRDNMLNIPDRLAAELAGEDNQFTIHQKMTAEIKKAIIDVIHIIKDHEQPSTNE